MVCRVTFKSFVVLLGLIPSALAQRSDTIYQQLTNTGTFSTWISNNVTNIGQSGHTFFMDLPSPCSAGITDIAVKYSFDNTNFFSFANSSGTPAGSSFIFQATGAYPYVKLQFNFTNSGSCVPLVWYTGVVNSPYTLTQGIVPTNSTTDFFGDSTPNPTVGGNVVAVTSGSTLTPALVAPTVVGGNTTTISVTAGATVDLTALSPFPHSGRWYLDHMELTMTAAGTVTLEEGTGTTCGTNTLTLGVWTLATGVPLNLQRIRGQVLADHVCLAATTGNATGSWTWGIIGSTSSGY
jgi:hypothetical protein